MIKTKKAISNEIFVYIIAILIFGLTIYLSAKWIFQISSDKEQTDLKQLENQFKKFTDDLSYDYGSVRELKLAMSGKYTKVCLTDINTEGVSSSADPLIRISRNSGSDNNVFFCQPCDYAFTAGNFTIKGDSVKCFDSMGGYVRIRAKGMGKYIEIQ